MLGKWPQTLQLMFKQPLENINHLVETCIFFKNMEFMTLLWKLHLEKSKYKFLLTTKP